MVLCRLVFKINSEDCNYILVLSRKGVMKYSNLCRDISEILNKVDKNYLKKLAVNLMVKLISLFSLLRLKSLLNVANGKKIGEN